jgi:hypothetical protein
MSIEQTDSNTVALFDSVTGIAFGPVFTGTDSASPQDEADAFVRWFATENDRKGGVWTVTYGVQFRTPNWEGVFSWPAWAVRAVAHEWRAFRDDHTEDVCPFDRDRDSYGIGYTGDSDRSHGDYTVSEPTPCLCECHNKEGR